MSSKKENWRDLAEGELRGRRVEDLTWKTLEGIEVAPLYTADDLEGLDHLADPRGVMVSGQWMDRPHLDSIRAAALYSGMGQDNR